MNWHGWLFLDGFWQRVCEADTLNACAKKLGWIGDERGVPVKCQAMTSGAVPGWEPDGK